jgi:tRNA pseudouridine38-40 synthase
VIIEGQAFLYNMVRIVVGTLMDVARGHLEEGAIIRAIASGARKDAGITAPAHGLVLEHVDLDLPEGTGEPWPPR